jgi:hypothetical protein
VHDPEPRAVVRRALGNQPRPQRHQRPENGDGRLPLPTGTPDELQSAFDAYTAAGSTVGLAAAKAKEATAAKDEALAVLVDLVKSDLRYAENHVRGNHTKLSGLGWGGRRPRKPRNVPGQVLGLEIVHEGPTSIALA